MVNFNVRDLVTSAASTALSAGFNKVREHFHLTSEDLKAYATPRNMAYATIVAGGLTAVMINPVTRVALCTFLSMSFTMTTILVNLMMMSLYMTYMGFKGISAIGSTAASIAPSITSATTAVSTIVGSGQVLSTLTESPLSAPESSVPEPFNEQTFIDQFDRSPDSNVESFLQGNSTENLVVNEQSPVQQLETSLNDPVSLEQEVTHLENQIHLLEEIDTTQVEEFDWDQIGREIEKDPTFNPSSVGSMSLPVNSSPILGGLLSEEDVAKNILSSMRFNGPVEKFDSQEFLKHFDTPSTGSVLTAGNIATAVATGFMVYKVGKWLYDMNQLPEVKEVNSGSSYASIPSSILKIDPADRPTEPDFNDSLRNALFL